MSSKTPSLLPARFVGEPYPRRPERRLAARLARKAHKAAQAERRLDARIKASVRKAGKKELAVKVALTRRESVAASPSPSPLVRKRKVDDDEHIADVAYEVASTYSKRQKLSMRKMAHNLDERASIISSNVLAALASTKSTKDKAAVVVKDDFQLKRKVVRLRKAAVAAPTSTDAAAEVDSALKNALTTLMNDAVETALMATLLALGARTASSTSSTVADNKFACSWWTDETKSSIAGLEYVGAPSTAPAKMVDQDLEAPKPRNRSTFVGKSFVSTSTSTIYQSSTPFTAVAAAVGPAFSAYRGVSIEPTSFAAYFEASALAALRPTPASVLIGDAKHVEVAPPLEPVAVEVKPALTEADEDCQHTSLAKLFKLVDGKWVCYGNGTVLLREAKAADEDGKKPSRLVFRARKSERVRLNVALFKGFKIQLGVSGGEWVRFSSIEGGSTASYLMRLANGRRSLKLVSMAVAKAEAL